MLCSEIQVFFLGFLCPPIKVCAESGFEINEEAGRNLLWRCHQSLLCLENRSCLLCKYFSLFIIGSGLLPKQYTWTSQYLWQTVFRKKGDPACFCSLGHKLLFPLSMRERGWRGVNGISSFSSCYVIVLQYNAYC